MTDAKDPKDEIKVEMKFGKRPEFDQAAIDETAEAAAKAKREFKALRRYVKQNFTRLRGQWIPIEVLNVAVIESHNCLVVNDLLLLSYAEAKELLEQITDE